MGKRTWAEINLNALLENFKEVRRITSPTAKIMAIVKADAYGHGVTEVTKKLAECGVDYLGVACLDEGKQLRRVGIKLPILILGASFQSEIEELLQNSLMPSVFSYDFAKEISDVAVRLGKKAKIHIKIDTGMSRIGLVAGDDDEALCDTILKIAALPNIEIDGIFSHFSTSDEADDEYTNLQFERFSKICDMLKERNLNIPNRHIANSAAIVKYPKTHLDMVRAGVILYGLYPSHEIDSSSIKLTPVMTVKSKVTMLKTLPKDRGISYGKTYITNQPTKIATIPIGYADGYTRLFSGKAKMMVKNTPVSIVGRICMDQCMIDVTNVNTISTGDEVIIFGADTVTADYLADLVGTINYEIVCMISKRVPRIYLEDGKAVKTLNYLNHF